MGIKELWSLLTPYCERKPLYDLQGKTVAIDLAGWICESMNAVDYFIHPRQYLKNLYFRTSYLLLEGVIPIFILEGEAPKLKENVINKRNELQFRGNKPKTSKQLTQDVNEESIAKKNPKGRTRFNYVLKQCETLLKCMGISCVQAPGEAEAYGAFLNKKGLVDGIISQDSDCFAYGAITVYRNFSVSSTASSSASVDVYDMNKICQHMDFGQNKIILLALICGCDYCDGVAGVGKDSVLKFFNQYKNDEVLERAKLWRSNDDKFTSLEMKVENKNICSNCGHLGKTQSHTRNGCATCRTFAGCNESLWKEQRQSIKAELLLRKKSLIDPQFPSEDIIQEFLSEPSHTTNLNLNWSQPNLVKFIKCIGNLIQWPEIYCFQKFLPLITRWLVRFPHKINERRTILIPNKIIKKRTLKGIASYEIHWKDEHNIFAGLIPDEQIKAYIDEERKNGIDSLWSTIEPQDLVQKAYGHLVEEFQNANTKLPKKAMKKKKTTEANDSLNNFDDLANAVNKISKKIRKPRKQPVLTGLQSIENFCIKNSKTSCSTPKLSAIKSREKINLSALDNELDNNDENMNLSEIINGMILKPSNKGIKMHAGRMLFYEASCLEKYQMLNETKDDIELLYTKKRTLSNSPLSLPKKMLKRKSYEHLDLIDSEKNNGFETTISNCKSFINLSLESDLNNLPVLKNHVHKFMEKQKLKGSQNNFDFVDDLEENDGNRSYFFQNDLQKSEFDEFERSFELSTSKYCVNELCDEK